MFLFYIFAQNLVNIFILMFEIKGSKRNIKIKLKRSVGKQKKPFRINRTQPNEIELRQEEEEIDKVKQQLLDLNKSYNNFYEIKEEKNNYDVINEWDHSYNHQKSHSLEFEYFKKSKALIKFPEAENISSASKINFFKKPSCSHNKSSINDPQQNIEELKSGYSTIYANKYKHRVEIKPSLILLKRQLKPKINITFQYRQECTQQSPEFVDRNQDKNSKSRKFPDLFINLKKGKQPFIKNSAIQQPLHYFHSSSNKFKLLFHLKKHKRPFLLKQLRPSLYNALKLMPQIKKRHHSQNLKETCI